MVGITLSAEQIRSAPPEVRRWLEKELLVSFGLQAPAAEASSARLVELSVDDASLVLSLIQGFIPIVNAFFELGREGASVGIQGVEAFRLVDILRHTRLQSIEQVINCLDAINQAVCRVRGDAEAVFYGLDGQGFCFIATRTQRSILRVWQHVVTERDLGSGAPAFAQASEPAAVAVPWATPAPLQPTWSMPAERVNASTVAKPEIGAASTSAPAQK